VSLPTLGQWIARGLIPGVRVGASGKRRDFDFPTAVRVAVFALLTKNRVDPQRASFIAQDLPHDRTQSGWLFVPAQDRRDVGGGPGMACTHIPELTQLPSLLQQLNPPPRFFVMIDIAQLAERVRQAERDWLQTRGGK